MTDKLNTMLDPSLFADSGYKSTFEMIEYLNEDLDYTVSESFYDLVTNGNLIDNEPVRDYFSTHTSFYEHNEMRDLFSGAEFSTFGGREYIEDYPNIYQGISEAIHSVSYYEYGEDTLVDILFDEFIFSIHNSPILSRKNIEKAFSKAVSFTIEISDKRLKTGWEAVKDEINAGTQSFREIKKQLEDNADERLDGEDPIWVSTYLRQAVKDFAPNWIIHISNNYIAPSAGAAVGASLGGLLGGPTGPPVGAVAGTVGGAGLQDFVMYLADP